LLKPARGVILARNRSESGECRLIVLTGKAALRTGIGELPLELRAARLAEDRALRAAVLAKLDRDVADPLAKGWAHADYSGYQLVVAREVLVLKTIYEVGIEVPDGLSRLSRDEVAQTVNSVVNEALNEVPINAFASKEALEKTLSENLRSMASSEAKSTAQKYSLKSLRESF
jgi:hypothetical protein